LLIDKSAKRLKKNSRSITQDKLKTKDTCENPKESKNQNYHEDIKEKLSLILKLKKKVKVSLGYNYLIASKINNTI
jgi:hypothetical protein